MMKSRDAAVVGLLSGIVIGACGTVISHWMAARCEERKKRREAASHVSKLSEMVGNKIDAKSIEQVMREIDSLRGSVQHLYDEK